MEIRGKQSVKKDFGKGDSNPLKKLGGRNVYVKLFLSRKIWFQRAFLEVKFTYAKRGGFLIYNLTKSHTTYSFNLSSTPNFSFTLQCQVIVCNFKL